MSERHVPYSAEQYEDAITAAIGDGNPRAAVSLLEQMAVHHPDRAEAFHAVMQAALALARGEAE